MVMKARSFRVKLSITFHVLLPCNSTERCLVQKKTHHQSKQRLPDKQIDYFQFDLTCLHGVRLGVEANRYHQRSRSVWNKMTQFLKSSPTAHKALPMTKKNTIVDRM